MAHRARRAARVSNMGSWFLSVRFPLAMVAGGVKCLSWGWKKQGPCSELLHLQRAFKARLNEKASTQRLSSTETVSSTPTPPNQSFEHRYPQTKGLPLPKPIPRSILLGTPTLTPGLLRERLERQQQVWRAEARVLLRQLQQVQEVASAQLSGGGSKGSWFACFDADADVRVAVVKGASGATTSF